jgi:hypothetical protein
LTLELEMKDAAGSSPFVMGDMRKGRPPKSDRLTSAERASRARDKKKQQGMFELKCHIDQATREFLKAVCVAENCTISEAIAKALRSAICNGLALH